MFGSGPKTLSNVREWSRGPLECPEVLGRPSRMSGVVGRPSLMSGSIRESLLDVWERLGGPPGCSGVVERPS